MTANTSRTSSAASGRRAPERSTGSKPGGGSTATIRRDAVRREDANVLRNAASR